MTEPHHAACYADRARHMSVVLTENVQLARNTYRARFTCPEIARRVVPGQFVMVRLAGTNDPLLGRPLAVYDVLRDGAGEPVGLDFVYVVVGKMTGCLAAMLPGTPLTVWGPLGNGFPLIETQHLLMVAGGIGQTPFLVLAQEYLGRRTFGDPPREVRPAAKVTLCYGARSAEYLACVEDFRQLGVDVRLSTDDGTAGHHGLVTELIEPAVRQSSLGIREGASGGLSQFSFDENGTVPFGSAFDEDGTVPFGSAPGVPSPTLACRIVCCGPERMMAAAAQVAQRLGVPCEVSLESPMACGIGICFSCVAKIRDASGNWDYRRTCVEGPVFDAERVEF